ncbi:MAG TPA: M23 family metallopeptidase [Bryobacteraceae bacterium]|jgi:murein DD-endopeptidase MepM/ murein hydrolase activator NlpD|nr:M23 family metallopeptidase [Bryobacteraceae bacterium]
MLKIAAAALLALLLVIFGFIWFSGKSPTLNFVRPVTAVGTATPVSVEVHDPHGIKSFTAELEQDGQTQVLMTEKTATREPVRIYGFLAGKKQAPFLKEGSATLVVAAKSNDFRGATERLTQQVKVTLRPPTIVADGRQHYINQGGSELVTLELGGNWTEAGVRSGKYTAGTFAMPGQPENSNHRFSLFPYPWDLSPDVVPIAYARNDAGTEVTASFWVKVFPKQFRKSNIELNDRNMQKVVGELDPDGTGSLLDRFVKINREMRKANAQTIYDLRKNTEHRILWSGPFIPIKGTRESYFADDRSYYYQGKKVDEQVHLGFDLAQTTNMNVTAANAGKVIYAERLGIYGNCVILDHGYSLQTLYGHMSRIDVKVGDMVQKQQHIGVSGSTGMAFGDHVHFSMLIAGAQVNPIEWWDEHWIKDRILSKIASPAEQAAAPAGAPAAEAEHAHKKKHKR